MRKYNRYCNKTPHSTALATIVLWLMATAVCAQDFALRQQNDSLSYLTLTTDSTADYWRLPHAVYRFCTGDIDGDGKDEALVGVVKATRFDKRQARRLFIFKNVGGRIRAMWMGSRLGGELHDFRLVGEQVRCLESDNNGRYYITEYHWQTFGLAFSRYLAERVSRDEAITKFQQP